MTGVAAGFLGVGGGILLTPLLVALLGFDYPEAVGTSLAQMVGAGMIGAAEHRRRGDVHVRLGIVLAAGALGGVEVGTRALMALGGIAPSWWAGGRVSGLDCSLTGAYLLLLGGLGAAMVAEGIRARRAGGERTGEARGVPALRWFLRLAIPPTIRTGPGCESQLSLAPLLILGFVMGLSAGLLGIGGGFLMTPALIYGAGIRSSSAVGTNLFAITFIAAAGTVAHAARGHVDPRLVAWVMAGSLPGAQLGARWTGRVAPPTLRTLFGVALLISLALTLRAFIYRAWG